MNATLPLGTARNTWGASAPFFLSLLRIYLMTQSGLNKSQRELQAINQILESVGQAPVTSLNLSNPDVAIANDTLSQVSRDVQAEGWTFNREYHVLLTPDSNKEVNITDDMLQVALNTAESPNNKYYRATVRTKNTGDVQRKLYDMIHHTFEWSSQIYCDILWYHEYVAIPVPVQSYIIARASKIFAQRTVGSQEISSLLESQEMMCRAYALEYDTQQVERSFFGYNQDGQFYTSYEPMNALRR